MEEREREIQSILNSLPTQSLNAVNRLRQLGRDGIPALTLALRYPSPRIRAGAAKALARMNEPEGVPALLEAIEDPDAGVRLAAILGLSEVPGREAVQALGQALRGRHALVRDCAARALARRSLAVLRAALLDPDPTVRAVGAHGIGYYAHDRRSVARLQEMLGDDSVEVRVMAVRALAWIAYRHPDTLPELFGALRHPDEEVRAAAARQLGRIGNSDAAGALLALLDDRSKRVLLEAIHSLGMIDSDVPGGRSGIGGRPAIAGLLPHLSGPDADLRVAAAGAIAFALGAGAGDCPAAMLPALLRALSDGDPRVRAAAAAALGETGDSSALTPLHALLLGDPVWTVRASAASAMASLGDEAAIPLLAAACGDLDLAVSYRSERALKQLRLRLPNSNPGH